MSSKQKAETMAVIKNQTMAGADPSGVQPFIRGKLLDVMVYKGHITQLSVDAIVNAANGRLAHGAGVARAIADAAGDDLLKEGNKYIREHGIIGVTGVADTTAGRLPCKMVLHAVGPAMYDYKDETQCLEDLCKTILRCLCEARNLNMSSVAIPSISSGIFGVPKPSCAEMYVRAVKSFDTMVTGGSLRQVHFVDVSDTMLQLIQNEFVNEWGKQLDDHFLRRDSKFIKQCLNDVSGRSSPAGQGTSPVHSSNSAGTSGYAAAETGGKINSSTSAAGGGIQVIVYKDDIFNIVSDAIVCWKNPTFSVGDQVVAQKIFDRAGEKYKKQLKEIKKKHTFLVFSGLVFSAYCENMNQKLVVHGVISRNGPNVSNLKKMIPEIIVEVDDKKLISVVIPVFRGLSDGVKGFTETLCTAVKDFSRKKPHSSLKQIYVVDIDQKIVDVVSGIVQKSGINNETQSQETHTLQDPLSQSSSSPYHSVGGADAADNCAICMDTITNPKKLTKCGHTFCKDCIDTQFQNYKPVCPNCGELYGMLTGNMPTGGKMAVSHSSTTLPGYGYCGHYCIIYSFLSGRQTKEHPEEGKWYSGITRTAYIPDTQEGRTVLAMLRVAWERRLTFTIGRSVTTGQEGVITWNDIHHKTNTYGGQNKFGYPDPGYLARVKAELADKGITEESIQDPKYKKLTGMF
ncbi:protein mono-ADP-ribosyltransferase PARP14-like [Gigantopelta aegis]|uniref:protein mono-ADP-ribosyltransferase PARP14-like n=1 Tax=Gigantopelta aegis TaxID=1735272 RepID=UPI001B88ADBB|nr:protein mono-ADP-ribosyltransferase PARP14-like [Gigantopelta aegis]